MIDISILLFLAIGLLVFSPLLWTSDKWWSLVARRFAKDITASSKGTISSSAIVKKRVSSLPPIKSTPDRIYTPRTPSEIVNVFRDRTDMEAEKSVQAHIGKWLRVEGVINNVYESAFPDQITVSVNVSVNMEIEPAIFLEFGKERWIGILETITPGDGIVAEGRIVAIERIWVRLKDCDVIDVRGKNNQATSL